MSTGILESLGGLCLQGFRNSKTSVIQFICVPLPIGSKIPLMVLDLWIILTASQTSSSEQITTGWLQVSHLDAPRILHFKLRFVLQFCILFWCSIGGTILPSSTLPPVDSAKSSVWIVAQFRCLNSHFFPYNGREMKKNKCRVHMPNSVGFVYPIYQHLPGGAN